MKEANVILLRKPQKLSLGAMYPFTGNQFNFPQNTIKAIREIQKEGSDETTRTLVLIIPSDSLPLFKAAIKPKIADIIEAINIENTVSENVTGRRDAISFTTLSPYTAEYPKFNLIASKSHSKYRTTKGLSRPSEERNASRLSWVASSPNARIAWSPGITEITKKVISVTKKRTASDDSNLLSAYLSITLSYILPSSDRY